MNDALFLNIILSGEGGNPLQHLEGIFSVIKEIYKTKLTT